MDENLKLEIKSILEMTDTEQQRRAISKIIAYLVTLPISEIISCDSSRGLKLLFHEFVQKAFELLPSSVLPRELSNKIKMNVGRKRQVSFSSKTSFFQIQKSEIHLSPEGKYQQFRESESSNITNTDFQRKFIPKQVFSPGMKCDAQEIGLICANFVNKYRLPQSTTFEKKFTMVNVNIEDVLKNPSILKMFE